MTDDWRTLRVGDRIRFIHMPTEFVRPDALHPSTRRVYKRLIERNKSVRVYEIDEWSMPWIRCQFRGRNGRWEYHGLLINHDGWTRVKRRRIQASVD